MNRTGRILAVWAAMVWAFMSLASCSGSGAPEAKPEAPPKGAPQRGTQTKLVASQWVGYGSAKDGTPLYYDANNVERSADGKIVKFWSKVTPSKNSKIFTEFQKRVKDAGKDPNLLDSFKNLHAAKCASMTYDITRTLLLDAGGRTLAEESLLVQGRTPGPDVRTLMTKLCAAGPDTAPKKATPKSAGPACERAGVMVLIQPEEAIQAGAQWRIEGKEWKNSGEAVCNLPVDETTQKGTYRVEYKPLPGTSFIAPEPHSATVSADYKYSFYNTAYASKAKDHKGK